MDTKPFQNILKNVLMFLVIFLIINFIFNQFFAGDEDAGQAKTGIEFQTTSNSFVIREDVTVDITNYDETPLTIANRCPETPLPVQFFNNGEWIDRQVETEIGCDDAKDIVIESGQTETVAFAPFNQEVFNEIGEYKILLPLEDKTLETSPFKIKNPSFLRNAFTVVLYQPIYNALIFTASVMPNFDLGLAIILLTILIRTILLVPNQRALKSQKRLQEIQPKIAELKTKHGDNKEKIAMETMAIYKQNKVNPLGSCLPLLIQLPILIALFYVIQSGLDTGNTHLLYGPLADFNISAIETNFLGILELTKVNFIVLPIIVGALQFAQMKLSFARSNKKKDSNKPKASEMEIANRTMVYIMPLMIAVFTASVPAGVGLYWAFSTIYGIIQQFFINRSVKSETTEIRVVKSNKEKKEEYKKLNEKRKNDKNGD